MNTTQFIPEPLFVYDNASKTDKGYIGTFDILNRKRHEEGYKWIGDVKPYGGTFPDYDEAKAYAKLFAASPEMLDALKLALPYVEGAYDAAFPDSDHNDYVLNAVKIAIAKATP